VGISIVAQLEVKTRANARILAKGHVPARLL
jgi:hypothetical protein